MRIQKLNLLRIGPFTDQSLTFDQGNYGFHLVYGPNEAGKSSTLRALTQWLFGMSGESKSRDHFVHAHKNLRVGGTIQSHDGTTLTCIRRPGGQTSLRAENDRTKIDPAELSSFLSGLTREQFEAQFGIDLPQLIAGGKAIAMGGGELGESLFAAGSGAASMPLVLRTLEAQCDELFKPSTGKTPKVNGAIAAYNSARKEVRDASIKSKDWQLQSDELDQLRRDKNRLDQQQVESRGERDRLRRIRDSLPSIGKWNDHQRELQSLGDVTRLRDDFATQRVAATEALLAARSAQKLAAEEMEALSTKIDVIGELPSVLDHESVVEGLFENLSLFRQWVRSLPTLQAECNQAETSAKQLLKTLGKPPSLDQADGLRISPAARTRIRDLAEQRSGLLTVADQSKNALGEREAEIKQLANRLAEREQPADPSAMKKAIAVAQKLGDLDETIRRRESELTSSRSEADNALSRLPLWSGSLGELLTLEVPSTETVLNFANERDNIEQSSRKLADEIMRVKNEVAAAREDLKTLTLSKDVPTESSLRNVRSDRDHDWRAIESSIHSGANDDLSELFSTFADKLKTCDEVSDRLRREAQAVSEKARLIGITERCDGQLSDLHEDKDQFTERREALDIRWNAAWHPVGIEPLSPNEMKGWLGNHATLVNMATRLQKAESERQHDLDLRQKHIESLSECCGTTNHFDQLGPILDECVDRHDAISQALTEFTKQQDRLETLRKEKAAAEKTWQKNEQEKSAWQEQWDQAMVSLESNGSLSANEAQAVLDTIDQLIQHIDSSAKLAGDLATRQQQVQGFESQVNDVVAKLAFEVGNASSEANVADLHDELKRARESKTTRDQLTLQSETVDKQLRTAVSNIEVQVEKLSQLCKEAGCDTADQLPEMEVRSSQRRSIEQAISETESELRGLTQGVELPTFVDEAMQEDADQLSPRIDQLTEQVDQLEAQRSELHDTIAIKQEDLKRIDGNDKAAAANEVAEEALARTRTHAEDYVRAKLGSIVLRTAVTRYRERNQRPILKRASELFSQFTLGSFSGLESDSTDEQGDVLVGVRANSGGVSAHSRTSTVRLVHVDEMSEGTCDQLFLSLRLASLEVYLDASPPFPLIVDDILSNFDDERSTATLAALAELSAKTQVIMFTHHQHIVELAKRSLPSDVLFPHTLGEAPLQESVQSIEPKTVASEKKPKNRRASTDAAKATSADVANTTPGELF